MNIGEVSKQSDVNSKLIRRYEELNIIPKAGRSLSGYRQYSDNDVHVLRFVKRARELGFAMKDIKQLISLWKNKCRPSSQEKILRRNTLLSLKKN